MKANYKIAIALVAGITIGGTTIASAQSLKSKIVGGWTLVEGSEIMADGKKVVPWAKAVSL
jgi:tmRNA-binding protein